MNLSDYLLDDKDLLAISNLTLIPHANLAKRTSMKTQARAALVAMPHDLQAMQRLVRLAHLRDWPLLVLGGGTNTIFATAFFEGIVLVMDEAYFGRIRMDDEVMVTAGAAADLNNTRNFGLKQHLMGMEFCKGIPGTVGGALAGNAGAGNIGLCDYLERALLLTREGEFLEVQRGGYRYGYRYSELSKAIIVEAELRLEPLDHELSRQREKDFLAKKKGQPYSVPSSGCVFKNPKDPATGAPVSAGMLIDRAGLKGYTLNGVVVSENHANFLVNTGRASGEDFLAMISLIQDVVHERFGIMLEIEARIVGGPLTSCVLH